MQLLENLVRLHVDAPSPPQGWRPLHSENPRNASATTTTSWAIPEKNISPWIRFLCWKRDCLYFALNNCSLCLYLTAGCKLLFSASCPWVPAVGCTLFRIVPPVGCTLLRIVPPAGCTWLPTRSGKRFVGLNGFGTVVVRKLVLVTNCNLALVNGNFWFVWVFSSFTTSGLSMSTPRGDRAGGATLFRPSSLPSVPKGPRLKPSQHNS